MDKPIENEIISGETEKLDEVLNTEPANESNEVLEDAPNAANKQEQIDLVTVSGVQFTNFESEEPNEGISRKNLDIMQDINMKVTVELGRTKSSVKKVLDMTKGSIVELNKIAGEPVELFVNDKLVAYGEVIVMEDKFGLRVTNIAKTKE